MAVTSGSFETTHRISGNYNTYAVFNWWVNSTDSTGTNIGWNVYTQTKSSYQTISGTVASVYINGTYVAGGWSGTFKYNTQILSGTFHVNHTADYTFSASMTTTMYNSTQYNGSGSWTLAGVATAPSGLTATLEQKNIYDTGALISVNLSSYGTPSSESNRYIEAAILGSSSYGAPYRYATSTASTSADIKVTNSSYTYSANPLTIVPNTTYHYGAWATNTVLNTSVVSGSFNTLPARIDSITMVDDGLGHITFTLNHAAEGTAETIKRNYKIGSGSYTTFSTTSDTVTLTVTEQTTFTFGRYGATSGWGYSKSITVTPKTTPKIYGSVDGVSKEITKLYGSVDGKARKIKKLYGSVNGRSELIYYDES